MAAILARVDGRPVMNWRLWSALPVAEHVNVAPIRFEVFAPIDAVDFDLNLIAVNTKHHEMVRIVTSVEPGLHKMLQGDLLAFVLVEVLLEIRLAGIRVDRRAPATGDDMIHAITLS